jgi:ATP-dependent protease HslVU (ClpYQ) ATPase subunit
LVRLKPHELELHQYSQVNLQLVRQIGQLEQEVIRLEVKQQLLIGSNSLGLPNCLFIQYSYCPLRLLKHLHQLEEHQEQLNQQLVQELAPEVVEELVQPEQLEQSSAHLAPQHSIHFIA